MNYFNGDTINDLLKNDNYINWLDNFTDKHGYFFEDSWGKDNKSISDLDKDFVSKMIMLFTTIDEYSRSFNFTGYINGTEIFYQLRHDSNYYIIGVDSDIQSTFCRRVPDGDDSFIDYSDIKDYYLDSKSFVLQKK